MTIDCIDSADDTTGISDSMDGFGCETATSSWNGRDVEIATQKHYRLALIAQFYALALQQINNMAQVETDASRYELLDLQNELIEEISQNFDRYAEATYLFTPYLPSGREFTLADLNRFQAEIAYCKGFWKKVGNGFTDLGKGIKKGAKKTVDFVKDHKTECLIGLAVVAAACGLVAIAGACGGAAAAANGVDATQKKREDEEDPHSNDHPSSENPPPVAVPPPVNNPPPDPNAVTHFLEGLRTGKIEPVSQPTFDLSHKNDTPATPEPVAPPPANNPPINPNALNNFIEGLRTGKIEPVSQPIFDLSHKSDSPATPEPVAPPPVDNPPINPNALTTFIEGLRTGKIEPVEKPVFDLSHKSDSAAVAAPVAPPPANNPPVNPNALNNFIEGLRTGKIEPVSQPVFDLSHKSDSPVVTVPLAPPISAPSPEVSAHFANAITTFIENLRSGKIEPTSKPSFDLSYKSDGNRTTTPVAPPPNGNPSADAAAQMKSTIASYLEVLQRSAIDLSAQSSGNPSIDINVPLQSAIANYLEALQHKAIDQAAAASTSSIPAVNPSPDTSIRSAIMTVLGTLGHALNPFDSRPSLMGVLSPLLPPLSFPFTSCHFRTEGIRLPKIRIGFINGMNTTFEEFKDHLEHIKKFAGNLSIDGVYNHNKGLFLDSLEVILLNYAGIAPITSTLLLENWTEFHEENRDDPDAKYLQFAHSKGTVELEATLKRAPQEIRDRVIVVCIGTAAAISKELCYESFPYASKNDLAHLGEDLYAFLVGEFSDEDGRKEIKKRVEEKKQGLILLEPLPGDKGPGHDFQNPIFDDVKQDHIKKYFER